MPTKSLKVGLWPRKIRGVKIRHCGQIVDTKHRP
nr:MAG TPA: hypothetical protein [Caudoviricetes sp.]